MGKCLKGKSEVKKQDAAFQCDGCGALTEKKGHVCEPIKLHKKDDQKKHEKKKDKKGK